MSNDPVGDLLVELISANRAYQRAVDVMDEATGAYLGINRSDGRCIDLLEEHGPMSAGELAAAARLSPGAITTLVDRLEAQGYVARVRDPQDRRRVLIEVTEEARRLSWELYGPMAKGEAYLRTLTIEQLEVLRDFLNFGTEINLENAERVRSLPPRERTRRRAGRPAREEAV